MTTPDPASVAGTFEFIEAKIRRDAEGTSFGGDFEWLCQWFLENAPRYRGQFDKVWLWKNWPDRWGIDAGIDLVARTRAGELWAIQAKADHPDRAITKREIDSFLSESNRPQFAYRLLLATTDNIGATARRTLHGQEKPVGLALRGDFLTAEVQWPVQIGGAGTRLPPWPVKPHQTTAIEAVVHGFRDHDRGRLIMACGTGKTLTALWIAERLQCSLTLVLVPSLSLVQQNLAEWGRNSAADFDTLIVCSDETVGRKNADEMIQSAADLAVKPTTDPEQIRHFLQQRRKRPAVVFATYQSSNRIAAAQAGKTKTFDLVICDESHRLAGDMEGEFATVLDGKKIKASKRLFMTATPRYIKDHVKRRAAELDTELVSMDDVHVFGPEFHALEFHEAMNAKPDPLLTDYQVVVIGVTDRDAKAWAEEARLVRTAEDLRTDARTLAAQIGLAKAMQKYNLRKIITFHSTVAKAARFVDATQRDSLPGVISHLKSSARPSGKLWTKHISGETPAGMRATLLKEFADLPEETRGILSNCACLGEGVDVPVLDGVAFIDPKRSMVDIIQAVGRVIRKAAGKQLGTIVIPVFIDESEDADHVLSQSAFEPVWQVLKALRAHDRRLADELDQLRLSLGRRSKSGGRISLPDNIHLDVPRLLLHDFEQAFYVRTLRMVTSGLLETLGLLKQYVAEHGWERFTAQTAVHDVQLGKWVTSRRVEYKKGILADWLTTELEAIPGWSWNPITDQYCMKLVFLRNYVKEHGWKSLPRRTAVEGVNLFAWVNNLRQDYRKGNLSDSLKAELELIPGWSWDAHTDRHNRNVEILRVFVAKPGWSKLRAETAVNGVQIGQWVTSRRVEYKKGRLADWLRIALEVIPGWSWDPYADEHRNNLQRLHAYVTQNGWDKFTVKTVMDGVRLGTWARNCRKKKAVLPEWLKLALEETQGWSWSPISDGHSRNIKLLQEFVGNNGLEMLRDETVVSGVSIGKWVSHARRKYRNGELPDWLRDELEAITGWSWDPVADRHRQDVGRLRTFVAKHGWKKFKDETVIDGVDIGSWVSHIRQKYKAGKLRDWLAVELENISGWRW